MTFDDWRTREPDPDQDSEPVEEEPPEWWLDGLDGPPDDDQQEPQP